MLETLLQKAFGRSKVEQSLPTPEPLHKAMNEIAREDTPATREGVYQAFLNSWLWFCVPEMPEGWKPGMTVVTEGMKIQVATPNNNKGDKVLPVFTDIDALKNYDPNTPHLAFQSIEVFKMALKMDIAEIVVNPFDPVRKPIRPGGTVTRREFEALANGMIPQRGADGRSQVLTVKKPTQVQIGRCPTSVSAEIRARLHSAAIQFVEVERIFRFRTRYVETGTISDVLGLVCNVNEERVQAIAAGIMSAIQPLLPSGQYIDLKVLGASDLALMQQYGEVVYERETNV